MTNPQTAADFRKGDRVMAHPATDAWMRGDRYGTVVHAGALNKYVHVLMDTSNKVRKFTPDLLEMIS